MNRNPHADDGRVREHYRDASNLQPRMELHERFSTDTHPWHRWAFDRIQPDLPEDARVLEPGCGTAKLWTENHDRVPPGWRIALTDASPDMLSEARSNINLHLSYTMTPNFSFTSSDARSLPFGGSGFDAVVCNHVLYHIPGRERVFGEVKRVLKPGGVFFAATNGEDNMKEMERFRRILDPGYRVGDRSSAFTLENGMEQLEPWFGRVELRRRKDGLRVTVAGPLVEYILSMMDVREVSGKLSGAEFGARVRELVGAVEGEVSSRGSVSITKSVGMFVARA